MTAGSMMVPLGSTFWPKVNVEQGAFIVHTAISLCSQDAECWQSPRCADCCCLWAPLPSNLAWPFTASAVRSHSQSRQLYFIYPEASCFIPFTILRQWLSSSCARKIDQEEWMTLCINLYSHMPQPHNQTNLSVLKTISVQEIVSLPVL